MCAIGRVAVLLLLFVSIARAEYCISKAGLSMLAKLFAVRLAEATLKTRWSQDVVLIAATGDAAPRGPVSRPAERVAGVGDGHSPDQPPKVGL